MDELIARCGEALTAAERLLAAAKRSVAALVTADGAIDGDRLDRHQFAAHGFAWLATYVTALRQLLDWAERLRRSNALGETETLILAAGFGEYLAQMAGGIAISQGEIVRPADLGLGAGDLAGFRIPAVEGLIAEGAASTLRERLARRLIAGLDDGDCGEAALDDDTLAGFRDQIRRFAAEQVAPFAQDWHREDRLIPMTVIESLAKLGVFGLTIPAEHGGLGLGKVAMCVVTEELSRASLGVGSLGTRPEIAGELIRLNGTEAQKRHWLPRIASGACLPTAVFTEPETGSDLGSLKTRAVRDGDVYRITGAKTWITHAARADLMTLLVRTDANAPGYRGLSMFLAEKPRGTETDPFPVAGLRGSEIRVIGYRGLKEYELAFDGFVVPASAILGEAEGQGFKQLMATFESARIQTAARAVGVAQAALDQALRYAAGRRQFGQPIAAFPRVAGKLAAMAVETMIARQLSWFAAREKDSGRRVDVEAGMAKLLAARAAWAAADNAVQVHGGNGYAEEYTASRLLVDARILNIFEGAAEIQAQVIARGLLTGRN